MGVQTCKKFNKVLVLKVGDINGVKVLQHDLFTNDVLYIEDVFYTSSLKQGLLPPPSNWGHKWSLGCGSHAATDRKDAKHTSLKYAGRITKSEGHSSIGKRSKGACESRIFLIFRHL
ncbi:hypothetical protein F3Y22_tig00110895pilonHSYRG00259 [Hibiscus syriacus]|uniref:Uncharacterized protein n=1 Tax=Hibiscus syriacus TaxID=106335 RepID=A0A6A2ZEV7_HIBSY|nr:hypothetical protein F3Y22_tig00110895pilonHSYRG00259 [Hibiscus syriacus]